MTNFCFKINFSRPFSARKRRRGAFLCGSVFLCAAFCAFLSFCGVRCLKKWRGEGRIVRAAAQIGVVIERKFPEGVRVCGVDVGGKEKSAAFALIRAEEESRMPPFYADTWRGTEVFYPYEIGFTDDLEEIFLRAKKGGSYECKTRCYLKGDGKRRLFFALGKTKKNARVIFGKDGFSYEAEEDGLTFDEKQAEEDLLIALSSLSLGEHGWEFPRFSVQTRADQADFTLKDAVAGTREISSFSTKYALSNTARSKNISLSAAALNGVTIESGGDLSFNERVGERTSERGYEEANVIQGGEFVAGVGGGVCQVSTTLFNAALLGGLEVTERRAHSLAVGYVPASRDAMVSNSSDLKIRNPFPYPVYLRAECAGGSVRVTFYGVKGKRTYALESEQTGEIPPPEAEKKRLTEEESAAYYGTEAWEKGEAVIRPARFGVKSVLYRSTYENGKLIGKTRLFCDRYSPVRGIVGIIVKKIDDTSNNSPSNVCLFRKKML